ncbi:hypothetical protein HYDPIDRAFT_113402 [Hydnomerulius pinastri MD-312]|uniref:non-specific serine/threonine protein kinase n=1 Tax=Hydnomerulius pinastri MD-312 TaxID=994086 RepID=A0A0C9WEJ7_9AGAM|nr:hypothetical protein HYDPIDRAFT_113402 [Hydnomerulius pinastri MD-312]
MGFIKKLIQRLRQGKRPSSSRPIEVFTTTTIATSLMQHSNAVFLYPPSTDDATTEVGTLSITHNDSPGIQNGTIKQTLTTSSPSGSRVELSSPSIIPDKDRMATDSETVHPPVTIPLDDFIRNKDLPAIPDEPLSGSCCAHHGSSGSRSNYGADLFGVFSSNKRDPQSSNSSQSSASFVTVAEDMPHDGERPNLVDGTVSRFIRTKPLCFGGHAYMVTRQIGQGSFGFIWHAFDECQNEVAIKVLHKPKVLMRSYGADHGQLNKACTKMIMDEVLALQKITASSSPFLTPLLASFSDEENVYLVMRMYSANLLGHFVRLQIHATSDGRFLPGVDRSIYKLWAAEILLGLQTLHGLGVMHRDVKMENILITPAGHVAIADFGLAVFANDSQSIKDVVRTDCYGTPGYLAPEQHPERCNFGYDYRVDIYAYGLLLLEMGVSPFWFHSLVGDGGDPGCLPPYDPRIKDLIRRIQDPDAQHIVSRILVEDPNERPDWEMIKKFPFFNGLDWDTVARRLYYPHFTPCSTPFRLPRNAASGIRDFQHQYSERSHGKLKLMLDHFARENDGLGTMEVSYTCPDAIRSDPLHGETCTRCSFLRGDAQDDITMDAGQREMRRCRYFNISVRRQHHF